VEAEEPAAEDHTATEPTEDGPRKPGERGDDSEGGPYGNPEVDEETLRKKQEEARRQRCKDDDG
jgi:hypothetical protein